MSFGSPGKSEAPIREFDAMHLLKNSLSRAKTSLGEWTSRQAPAGRGEFTKSRDDPSLQVTLKWDAEWPYWGSGTYVSDSLATARRRKSVKSED